MSSTNVMMTKADELIKLMSCTIEEASERLGRSSESGFEDVSELQANGWIHALSHPSESEIGSTGVTSFCTPHDEAPFRGISFEQGMKFRKQGSTTEHDATYGNYSLMSSADHGILIAETSRNPTKVSSNKNDAVAPDLYRWSDIAFLGMKAMLEDAELKAPAYILRSRISEQQTREIVDHICRTYEGAGSKDIHRWGSESNNRWTPPDWPGLSFHPSDQFGKLLIGTPGGKGVAWLLIQHKAAFGIKTIEKARIWTHGVGVFSMLLYVGAAESSEK